MHTQYCGLPHVSWPIARSGRGLSASNKPGIRGFRNLGILASYVLVVVFLFVAGWRSALATWTVFGFAGGLVYILWEILQRLRTAAGERKPEVSLSPLFHGLFGWPIMVPEAIEYALAELGLLSSHPSAPAEEIAKPGAAPDGGHALPDDSRLAEGPPSVR